ncbi:MAG: hypothetical protein ACI9SC_002416, partial [Gammaproteobacteria bacterium]
CFCGEVVHGSTVNGAKDANPVKQFSKLLYNVPFKRSTTVYYEGL